MILGADIRPLSESSLWDVGPRRGDVSSTSLQIERPAQRRGPCLGSADPRVQIGCSGNPELRESRPGWGGLCRQGNVGPHCQEPATPAEHVFKRRRKGEKKEIRQVIEDRVDIAGLRAGDGNGRCTKWKGNQEPPTGCLIWAALTCNVSDGERHIESLTAETTTRTNHDVLVSMNTEAPASHKIEESLIPALRKRTPRLPAPNNPSPDQNYVVLI